MIPTEILVDVVNPAEGGSYHYEPITYNWAKAKYEIRQKEIVKEDAKILARRCDEAFDLYPRDCSHAVYHVIRAYKPEHPYMQANALVAHASRSTEWAEVQLSNLSGLANQGVLVIGGLQEEGHGHVIVVYPGPEKPKGGSYFINKETGEKQFSEGHGDRP